MLKVYWFAYVIVRGLSLEPEVIKTDDLREQIIIPTLVELAAFNPKLNSKAAVNLLMGTAATESLGGYYLVQNNGPGLGIYSMEPATHDDIWRYLNRPENRELRNIVSGMSKGREALDMVHDIRYATAMARIKYWMRPEPMPRKLETQARYWKKHYNTPLGRGTVSGYLQNYRRYAGN